MSAKSEETVFWVVFATIVASFLISMVLIGLCSDDDSWTIDGNSVVHIHKDHSAFHDDHTTVTTYYEEGH